jgi:hypothetical protein
MDHDDSGDITLEELKAAFKKHESLFKTLTVSTSIWIKPKFITVQHKRTYYHKIKEIVINKRALCIFWTSYILINFACMLTALLSYIDKSPFVIIARMFGNSLNFNCSLILVLVLRKHLTWLREKGAGFFVPIDDSIEIHKKIGIVILIETLMHTLAHLINLYFVCKAKSVCSNYWSGLFTTEISLGFPTGIIDFFLLIIILIFAMPYVRNKGYFQVHLHFIRILVEYISIFFIFKALLLVSYAYNSVAINYVIAWKGILALAFDAIFLLHG